MQYPNPQKVFSNTVPPHVHVGMCLLSLYPSIIKNIVMAATLKKHVESKYVTVFKDSEPDADITFRDDLLESPAENYQVGVDHLTVNAGAFSMFPDVGDGSDQVSDPIILCG